MGDEGKIFVGGLHWNTTAEGLKAYFEQFGQVTECTIMKDPTGRSRCFGFVTFGDSMVVDVIMQKTHILDKKQIDPKRAIPKDQPHPSPQVHALPTGTAHQQQGSKAAKEEHKVFVGGIHVDADENELREAMSQFDEVVETILMRDRETGRSRGFGFITFASMDGAYKACADSNLSIRDRKVEVKMAVPKNRVSSTRTNEAQTSPTADPYAAWTEYFKQYPEYYEAMMKAYSNPSALASYYSQYYGNTANGAATQLPISPGSAPIASYDPVAYYSLMNNQGSSHSSIPPPIPGHSAPPSSHDAGNYYYAQNHSKTHSSSHSVSRSPSDDRRDQSKSRSKSRSRSRSRSRIRSGQADSSRSRSRSRGRSRSPRNYSDHRRRIGSQDGVNPPNRRLERARDYPRNYNQHRERPRNHHAGNYGHNGEVAPFPNNNIEQMRSPGHPPLAYKSTPYYRDPYATNGQVPHPRPPPPSVPISMDPYDPYQHEPYRRREDFGDAPPPPTGRSYNSQQRHSEEAYRRGH